MGDDFSFLFSSGPSRSKGGRDTAAGEASTKEAAAALVPANKEMERMKTRKAVMAANDNLKRAKASFADKIEKLKKRTRTVQREQEKLRRNLVKYNNFVREKQSKVADGERVSREERDYQDSIQATVRRKREQLRRLEHARGLISDAVARREVFREYLQTVVDDGGGNDGGGNQYKDIGQLMKRCETLVVTRDEAKERLEAFNREIVQEESGLARFKEAQNELVLELSSRQNSLQDALYQIQATKDSRQRLLDQEEQELLDKELSVANIRLSILTLWQYVTSRKVTLPADATAPASRRGASAAAAAPGAPSRPPSDVEKQLAAVRAHIEDLEAVIARVRRAEVADGYLSPLVSISELRLDY